MTCQETIALLADYLETILPRQVLEELEAHLADCEPCRAYLATYRRAIELGAREARAEMPPEMLARLRDFLLARLGSAERPPSPPASGRT
jgi:predicted anti-sigma-YlaC factor YlaD